jgi:hypothetical protein
LAASSSNVPRPVQLVLMSLVVVGGVFIWGAIILTVLIFGRIGSSSSAPNVYKDTQRYAELTSLQSQLLLLPVAGQLTGGSSQSKSRISGAGLDTDLYIERDYHLASTPSYASVDSYYRSQLSQRGWSPPPPGEGINAPSSAYGLNLDFSRTGRYSDILCYSVSYYDTPNATLDLIVASSVTAGAKCD